MLVTPGAAAALFATATALLEPGDHAVVVRTNYATNLETPRAIGADLDVVDLAFDDGWQLDVDADRGARAAGRDAVDLGHVPAQPDRHDVRPRDAATRSSSWPNASGAVLLVDETYRDLTHGEPLPMAATLSPRAISVSSMSKAYGLPGPARRLGGVPRPRAWPRRCSAAKEQMVICGATLDEAIAGRVLADRGADPAADPRRRARPARRSCATWMRGQDTFEWIEPAGGVVGLVRFRPDVAVDTDRFYEVLLAEHGTYVGPGHWFEVDDRHFRLGFGWPTDSELRAGLAALDRVGRRAQTPGFVNMSHDPATS